MKNLLKIVVAIIAILALVSFFTKDKKETTQDNTIEPITLGYIVYPPLLEKDAQTGELRGVSYDIVTAVAEKLGREVEWTEEVGWGTALEGLNTSRYDVLGTQMWPNEARERVAEFSDAPFDSVLFPYVRADDSRFDNDISLINSPEVRVSAVDGELAVFIAAEDYPDAELKALPQLASYAEMFLNIVQNKADVSFTEPASANDFLKNNPGTLKQLDIEPLRSYGNSFAFAKNNPLLPEWNNAIAELVADGVILEILEKYNIQDDYLIQ